MDGPQDTNAGASDARGTMNLAMLLVQAYATSVEVFLHRHLGERYLGLQAVGVLVLVPFHAYLFQDYDSTGLMKFIVLYLLACMVQRVAMLWRRWKGVVQHSRYNGYPSILAGNTRIDEVFFKIWIEPPLVMGGGTVLMSIDPALGSYFVAAGFALFIKGRMMNLLSSSQLLDMQDTMFDQQSRAERFRAMNGDLIDSLRGRNSRSPWR